MGWQGRLRGAKAVWYFEKLPEQYRARLKLIEAYSWRSDRHVWLSLRENDVRHLVQVERKTGAILSDRIVP